LDSRVTRPPVPREAFLRSIERVEIFCEAMPTYALHVITREGLGWYCSRCGARVKVVA
jgi:hypothetical protein